jgi:hypothetical protein
MKDYVRVFHPTAAEEYANRPVSPESSRKRFDGLTFIAGCMAGALIVLFVGGF